MALSDLQSIPASVNWLPILLGRASGFPALKPITPCSCMVITCFPAYSVLPLISSMHSSPCKRYEGESCRSGCNVLPWRPHTTCNLHCLWGQKSPLRPL